MAADLKPIASSRYYALLGIGLAFLLAGLAAFHFIESRGHVVTGMDNRIAWGMPHVFAIFMIVAASGVLNVASIGSVFGQAMYKPRAPLSGLLCLALLAGGLFVLVLDLGRPERIVVAATHFNFKSVFAWNVVLYTGMFAIVGLYLWTLMEKRMQRHSRPLGLIAFVWRLLLTTATGSIFGFLAARPGYGSAILAPMFIALSFAWGLAVFVVVQSAMYAWNGLELAPAVLARMKNLLGIFVAAGAYFVAASHVTNAYFARQAGFEYFILVDGGLYPLLFWLGYGLLGTALPLLLVFHPALDTLRAAVFAAAGVLVGAFALLYVFIVGGQAWPMEIFPGYAATSSFGDGAIAGYAPSPPEILLGLGGLAAAFLITTVGVRILPFLPQDELR